MEYYAGLDIGGTNGRLKLTEKDGTILGEFQMPGFSVNTDGYEKSRRRCRDLVLPVLKKLELNPEQCRGICAAISGIDSESDAANCRAIFQEMGFQKECLQVVNDCEVFLNLSQGPALVLVSGTGSICYGRDTNNRIFRTGGWNHIVSDEGSGFDLGLKFLQTVAHDLDGRRAAPVLTSMIIKESGLDTLEKLNDLINANLFEKAKIARFARTGYAAAQKGDLQALRIHKICADMLYELVEDTLQKMDASLQMDGDLWLWGSILVKNQLIYEYVLKRIETDLPGLHARIPTESALDTAVATARSGKIRDK